MRAHACIAILAVLAMAVAGAFLVSDRGAPYASADGGTSDGITWSLVEGVLTLSPSGGDTAMPDYFLGFTPWLVDDDNRLSIAEVVIEDGITSIGEYAFYECYALASVSIQGDMTAIGAWAFAYCYALRYIAVPSGVEEIGINAFSGCYSLYEVEFLGDALEKIGGAAFIACYSLYSITIPSNVEEIGEYAFFYCYSLYSITIPSGVEEIGEWAFYSCYSLRSVTIESGVETIGAHAFAYCHSLASVDISSSVETIGNYAFYGCYSLSSITIPSGVAIGSSAFYSCVALRNIVFEGAPSSLGAGSFHLDDGFTHVTAYVWSATDFTSDFTVAVTGGYTTINYGGLLGDPGYPNLPSNDDSAPGGVTWAYDGSTQTLTFSGTGPMSDTSGWDALRLIAVHVVIGEDVTTISNYAFANFHALVDVLVPSTVTSIGDYAFSGCYSLRSVDASSATSIGRESFAYCYSLRSVDASSAITIDYEAFLDCYSLRSVDVSSATSIGTGAFASCYSLWSVDVSNATSIEDYAFYGCASLAAISAGATSIGTGAFAYCYSLESAAILAPGLGTLAADVFAYDYALVAVSVYDDGESATPTRYDVSGAASPRAIVVHYDGSIDGDVYAAQSPSGDVTLSGFAGAVQVGTSAWNNEVGTVLSGESFAAASLGSARTAYVSEGAYHTVTATADANGTITPSGSVDVPNGGSATFTFSANSGYAISSVKIDGVDNPAAAAAGTYTFSGVTGNHTISVATASPAFTVTASADANSTITPSGSVGLAAGGSATFTFSAKAGYAISDVFVDGASVPSAVSAGKYAFSGVTSNHTISVTSAPSSGGTGSGSGSGSGSNGSGDGAGDSRTNDGEDGGVSVALVLAVVVIAIAVGSAALWLVLGRRHG